MMQADPTNLVEIIDLTVPLIGLYDAPEPELFQPLVRPKPGVRACVFALSGSGLTARHSI